MPFDRDFAIAIAKAVQVQGWTIDLSISELPNPLTVVLMKDKTEYRLIIHARRITRQASSGANPSDHHRPAGEMHMQMIFDGDQRGRGIRNQMHFADGSETLLFGFFEFDDDYVIAAYDPQRHRNYPYSKSLQIKYETLQSALQDGMTFQTRQNGETVVAFRLEHVFQYLESASDLHQLNQVLENVSPDNPSININQVARMVVNPDEFPLLEAVERKRKITEVGRYIRRRAFEMGIKRVYDQCAVCNFQFDHVIDAAHIIAVSEGGTDTYDNGLGLCPTCHRMFDKGFILVDETGRIHLNPRYAEEYDQQGLAGSLALLNKTLREFLWLPLDPQFHPSPANLRRTFLARR